MRVFTPTKLSRIYPDLNTREPIRRAARIKADYDGSARRYARALLLLAKFARLLFGMAERRNPGLSDQASGKTDMKAFAVSLVSSVCLLAALVLPQTTRAQVPLVFQTTFADALCPEWRTSDGTSDAAVCQVGDGMAGWQDHATPNGNRDQITAAANNPNGLGGKGFRHWRGDGTNVNGGAMRITLPSFYSELWVRYYTRWSLGFSWKDDSIHYAKEHYWNNDHVFGFEPSSSNKWGLETQGTGGWGSSHTWIATMGGTKGDGLWHCVEYHVKQNGTNGLLEVWVDGVQYLSTTANLGSEPYSSFTLGSNQNNIVGAGANDYYTDYDDLAISSTGRIGCIGGPIVLAAPRNLRVQ